MEMEMERLPVFGILLAAQSPCRISQTCDFILFIVDASSGIRDYLRFSPFIEMQCKLKVCIETSKSKPLSVCNLFS